VPEKEQAHLEKEQAHLERKQAQAQLRQAAQNLFASGMTMEQTAKILGLSEAQVKNFFQESVDS
jgi:DNA-binding CsgD family transcriptional regulator